VGVTLESCRGTGEEWREQDDPILTLRKREPLANLAAAGTNQEREAIQENASTG
jgi:hypothetical protein